MYRLILAAGHPHRPLPNRLNATLRWMAGRGGFALAQVWHEDRVFQDPTGGAALAALSSAPIPASFPDATDPVLCTGCGHGEARDQSTLAFLWPTEHGRYQARIHPPEAPRCAKCAGRMVPTPLSAHAVLARRARL